MIQHCSQCAARNNLPGQYISVNLGSLTRPCFTCVAAESLPLAAQKLLHHHHHEKLGHFMNHEASNWLISVCSLVCSGFLFQCKCDVHLSGWWSFSLASLHWCAHNQVGPPLQVRDLVGIIPDHVTWGAQSGAVFSNLTEDFMLDVVGVVDDVLDRGDLPSCHVPEV